MTTHIPSPHGAIAIAAYYNFPGEPAGVTIRRAHTSRKIHLTQDEARAVVDAVHDMIDGWRTDAKESYCGATT